jgi:hypothetical protein
MRTMLLSVVLTLAAVSPGGITHAADGITPSAYLATLEKPVFRKGHTLPPLTRYGWTLPFDARVALARDWGYALEFGGYVTEKSAAKLDDPKSVESRLVKLVASDPKTYKLSVICSRRLPTAEAPVDTWARDAKGKLLNGKAESLDGTEWNKGMRTVYSPAAPDSVWELAGKYRADPIAKVRRKCPIAVVLNGGEYGIGVLGFAQKVWEKDPRIVKHKGDLSWYEYVSQRKAYAETLIASAVKKVAHDRMLYIYYTTTGGTHRGRGRDWRRWMYGFQWMKPVSDLASSEHYYRQFNSGWTGGKDDLLTQALNARGFEISNAQPLCYDWFCAGWPRKKGLGYNTLLADGGLGDLSRHMGFLKCMYVAGLVGGNAGYYAYPKGGFGKPFDADSPPHWLGQMIVFARVHALFSHYEDYIRDGELLPGPNKHVMMKAQPAYEFPTGDKDVRVVARKRKGKNQWIVAAWAAGGKTRSVKVDIPSAGRLELTARPCGGVYIVTRTGDRITTRQIDAKVKVAR